MDLWLWICNCNCGCLYVDVEWDTGCTMFNVVELGWIEVAVGDVGRDLGGWREQRQTNAFESIGHVLVLTLHNKNDTKKNDSGKISKAVDFPIIYRGVLILFILMLGFEMIGFKFKQSCLDSSYFYCQSSIYLAQEPAFTFPERVKPSIELFSITYTIYIHLFGCKI